ncbi:uncharacterized protein LOC130550897 isoform X2 [Triplophysa rosa]|uniref:uncharacterized protein LOC130550897 isoform X2 n=1 Tax=Triplophysa rosa TaxID=992332 RepID=UPI002545D07F|nr:uncharacterized protein LOC130550897 isoform X2 [Triplophysa rosa]
MPIEAASSAPRAWLTGCAVHRKLPSNAPERVVQGDGQMAVATLDSGSSITLVRTDVLPARPYEEAKLPIKCVHGDTREVAGRRVTISAKPGTWQFEVGVVPDLPVAVLLGRNWSGFNRLMAMTVQPHNGRARERRRTPGPRPVLMATEDEREESSG